MFKIKFIALCLTLALLGAKSYAQPSIAWQRCYGTTDNDHFNDAINTHDNGILAAIDYVGTDGDAEGLYDLAFPATLMKFDSVLNLEWYSSFGGYTNASAFLSVYQMSNHDYVAGGATSSIDGDFADNHGNTDLMLVRTDSMGDKIWSRSYGSPGYETFESFMPTMDGGYLICGHSPSSGGDIPGHYGSGFSNDGIVIKTDSMGNVLWSKNLGTSGDDGMAGNPLEIDRGYYILNVICNGEDFDMTGSGITGRKRWLIKMDSLGNIVDENIISGETDLGSEPGKEMIYQNGQILILDKANPLTNYFPDVHGIGGSADGGIGIFNTDLDFVDLKIFGGTLNDYTHRIIVDENGNYYVLGLSFSFDGDLLANYNNGSDFDYWLFKLDANFNVIWSRNFGGSGNCETGCGNFLGNLLIKNNMLYVFTQNQVPDVFPDYDIECGHVDVTAIAPMDAWLVAFDLTTGITNNLNNADKISVNPNPVNNSLIISTTFEEKFDLAIQSLTGAIVFKQINNNNQQINISTELIPNGTYILLVTTASGIKYIEKIIVMH